jgi:hypothetical protein
MRGSWQDGREKREGRGSRRKRRRRRRRRSRNRINRRRKYRRRRTNRRRKRSSRRRRRRKRGEQLVYISAQRFKNICISHFCVTIFHFLSFLYSKQIDEEKQTSKHNCTRQEVLVSCYHFP